MWLVTKIQERLLCTSFLLPTGWLALLQLNDVLLHLVIVLQLLLADLHHQLKENLLGLASCCPLADSHTSAVWDWGRTFLLNFLQVTNRKLDYQIWMKGMGCLVLFTVLSFGRLHKECPSELQWTACCSAKQVRDLSCVGEQSGAWATSEHPPRWILHYSTLCDRGVRLTAAKVLHFSLN